MPSFYWEAAYSEGFRTAKTLKLENRLYDDYEPDWSALTDILADVSYCYLGLPGCPLLNERGDISTVEQSESSKLDTPSPTGLIVKFDGVDGCGKSTLCQSVRTRCSEQLNVFVTTQFGSSDDIIADSTTNNQTVSQAIRNFALDPQYECDDIERQLLLNVISRRADRIAIARQSKSHDLVLVDRSRLSNLAYGLPLDPRFEVLARLANEGFDVTEIVFWIDTPLGTCAERLGKREADQVETKGNSYQLLVREQFQRLAIEDPRVIALDGSLPLEELTDCVVSRIYSALRGRKRRLGR
jgi:dTMP kinase